MTAYIVATVRITDQAAFSRYITQLGNLSSTFGGEPLIRGQVSDVLEGEGAAGERVVVTRFPDAAAIRAYLGSAAYRAAREHRVGAGEIVVRLVE